MKATTELEIKITGGRIIDADLSADGVCKLTVKTDFEAGQKPKENHSETSTETSTTEPKREHRYPVGLLHEYRTWD